MAGLRKLKLEAAVMLGKRILGKDIFNEENPFMTRISQPFDQISKDFLSDFSLELRKFKNINLYPDLIYLVFWCGKYKNKKINTNENNLRLGRGIIFHICPSNVPTNFIYSFFFGLLSGNSNIVKIPSKKFKEKEIILNVVKSLFRKKKYLNLKKSNRFIQYDSTSEKTKDISAICDGRIIWGGDKTVNDIKKIWSPERSIDITFPDRYSLSVINLKKLQKQSTSQVKILSKRFYYDGYMMNQLACNSPHFIFWVGKKNEKLQNIFWKNLSKIAEKKFIFDDVHIVDKYTNLLENIIFQKSFSKLKMFKNNLYVVNPNINTKNIENIRGINGTFFQKNINELKNLKKYITKKCQTVSYFGFHKNEFKNFIIKSNLSGIDRIVPIGKALEIDIVWDGYDIINSLSRSISIE